MRIICSRLPIKCLPVAWLVLLLLSCSSCGKSGKTATALHTSQFNGWELNLYDDSLVTRTRPHGSLITLRVRTSDTLHAFVPVTPHIGEFSCKSRLLSKLFEFSQARLSSIPDSAVSISPEAIYLAVAEINPEASKNSLRNLVKNERITSGKSTAIWPLTGSSSLFWAMAAWKVYCVTADREWLAYAFDVIDRTVAAYVMTTLDQEYGLLHGAAASERDILEATHPEWMNISDIYQTMSLATNVLAERAVEVLRKMAIELGRDGSQYSAMSRMLDQAVNDHLWLPAEGYFSQYLYGGLFPIRSSIADSYGEALAVALSMTSFSQGRVIIANLPRSPYGLLLQYPLAHSSSFTLVSPFTEAMWSIAAARVGNVNALAASISALLRTILLHIDSLDSVLTVEEAAAWYAVMTRALGGIVYEPHHMRISPVIPPGFGNNMSIFGIRYGNALIDLKISGSGSHIRRILLDGNKSESGIVPRELKGPHSIDVQLDNSGKGGHGSWSGAKIVTPVWAPPTPHLMQSDASSTLRIASLSDTLAYILYDNGRWQEEISSGAVPRLHAKGYSSFMFVPVTPSGISGYSSQPYSYIPPDAEITVPAIEFAEPVSFVRSVRADHDSIVELTPENNVRLSFETLVDRDGEFLVSVKYAPSPLGGKAAIRTLFVNGMRCGVLVFPRTGSLTTGSFLYSNPLRARLRSGLNSISVDYVTPYNVNPDDSLNTLFLESVKLIRL